MPINSVNTIKTLMAGDNSGSSSIFKSITSNSSEEKRDNSINAVSILLKNLLDETSMAAIRKNSTVLNSVKGAQGLGTKVKAKYVPSYNVRTPIVEIRINDFPIYPQKYKLGTNELVDARVNFQSFNLKLPMGGVEKSVQGSITLFTKNPEEILTYLDSWGSKTNNSESVDGFPVLSLRFGWAFSDSTFTGSVNKQVNTTAAMSPNLRFIITNIAMEDPGVAGTTFTLTLQDLGTTVLQNSSDGLIFESDYPQQQLRALLEGVMRFRLFTLDDILYLGKRNSNSPTNKKNILSAAEYNSSVSVIVDTNSRGLIDTEELTFFSTVPAAPVIVNNRNFLTVANDLASQCRCKWYPHRNTTEDISTNVNEESTAMSTLNNLSLDLKRVRSTSSAIDTDFSNKIKSDLGFEIKDGDVSIFTRDQAELILIKALKSNLSRLSSRCRLVWVQNVPSDWNTTGSKYYSAATNTNDLQFEPPPPYEEGAFFLLPDLFDDYDSFLQDLPVQYGPGASNLPYFYGSGQNVLQTSLGNKQPQAFGEVLALSATHNNLITQLAASAKESLAYAIEGKRTTALMTANNYLADDTSKPIMDSKKSSQAERDTLAGTQQKKIEVIKADIRTQRKSFTNRRSRGSLGIGSDNLLIADISTLEGSQRSRPFSDPGGGQQTASLKIRSRVASFLRWPTTAKIMVLGDPNLLRLGPGCFELFSYYPIEHEDGSITQHLNTLTSGVYLVTSIEHEMSAAGFTTSLTGTKAVDPINVPSSITNKLFTATLNEANTKESNAAKVKSNIANTSQAISNKLELQFLDVNLNDANFADNSLIAKELKTVLTTYNNAKK